jgi:hypothetical protein
MTERESEALERAAAEQDPAGDAEDKARRLRPELERYAEETEGKEADDLRSDRDAPDHASDGVAEHEQEMYRRGFEKEGPPE